MRHEPGPPPLEDLADGGVAAALLIGALLWGTGDIAGNEDDGARSAGSLVALQLLSLWVAPADGAAAKAWTAMQCDILPIIPLAMALVHHGSGGFTMMQMAICYRSALGTSGSSRLLSHPMRRLLQHMLFVFRSSERGHGWAAADMVDLPSARLPAAGYHCVAQEAELRICVRAAGNDGAEWMPAKSCRLPHPWTGSDLL